MASTRRRELTFSSDRGENICLSEDSAEASWFLRHSGNYIYASQSIEHGKEYSIEIEGSGHVDIGIVTVNPSSITGDDREPSFRRMNEVKVHKRKFSINVKLHEGEVISNYNDEEYKIKLDQSSAWLAIYPKFGEISAIIKCCRCNETESVKMNFSTTMGNNIRLEDNNTKAKTIYKSPGSICFPATKLKMMHKAVFQCSPLSENEKKPSRFHLKVMVHRENPILLVQDFKGTFDPRVKAMSKPPWIYIDLLERDRCIGRISVSLSGDGSVVYSINEGHGKRVSLPFAADQGVWLVFELFRVSLRLIEYIEPSSAACGASGEGADDFDSTLLKRTSTDRNDQSDLGRNQGRSVDYTSSNIQEDGASGNLNNIYAGLRDLQQGVKKLEEGMENLSSKIDTDRQNSIPKGQSIPNPFKLKFRKNYGDLVRDLRADEFIDFLFQESIINKNLYEKVHSLAQSSKRDANIKLLQELLDKEIDRTVFERGLKQSEQNHLIPLFFPEDPDDTASP